MHYIFNSKSETQWNEQSLKLKCNIIIKWVSWKSFGSSFWEKLKVHVWREKEGINFLFFCLEILKCSHLFFKEVNENVGVQNLPVRVEKEGDDNLVLDRLSVTSSSQIKYTDNQNFQTNSSLEKCLLWILSAFIKSEPTLIGGFWLPLWTLPLVMF